MAVDSTERWTIRQGGTHVIKIDLTRDLDEGDTVSSATIAEITTTNLTIGAASVGTTDTTINHRKAKANKWIKATISGHLAATGTYRTKVTFSTAGGVTDKVCVEDYVFDVVAA